MNETTKIKKTSEEGISVIRQAAPITPEPVEQNYSKEYISKRQSEIDVEIATIEQNAVLEVEKREKERVFLNSLLSEMDKLTVGEEKELVEVTEER